MAKRLTKEELEGRLKLVDYRLAMSLRCPIMDVSAHGTREDAMCGANPITSEKDAGRAWFYRAVYRIKTLLGSGHFSDPHKDPVVVVAVLNAHGSYPYTRPECYVVGQTIPWSPHFAQGVPVCFERPGRVWRSDGKTTLGHLLTHIAQLINFDEVIGDPSYGGYNWEAVAYWRSALGSKPITPDLAYPVLPKWFLGLESASPMAPVEKAAILTSPRKAVVEQSPRARVVKER